MLNLHLIFTVPIFFILLLFLVLNIFIEARKLHENLFFETNLLNIEQHTAFNSYLVRFNKSYKYEEYFTRLENFRESLEDISRLNKLDPGVHGITQFSDMSKEEFAELISINKRHNGYKSCDSMTFKCGRRFPKSEIDDDKRYQDMLKLPKKVDWREKGYIGPVLDQKMCLACWAITSVGVMEAMLAINRKYRVSLSVQEMLDCQDDMGCGGGNMVESLKPMCLQWFPDSITTEDNYSPLTMVKGKCNRRKTGLRTRINRLRRECDLDESILASLIANNGPVGTVVNGEPLKSYIGGIVQYSCKRNHNIYEIDHAVQIVGYDMSSGIIPHYIVKNSWGENYGIDGYIKIAMFDDVCGIAEDVFSLNVTYYYE